MGRNHRPIKETFLECSCGHITSIYRIDGRLKSPGHIKHLYCYKCRQVTGHIEIGSEWRLKELGAT